MLLSLHLQSLDMLTQRIDLALHLADLLVLHLLVGLFQLVLPIIVEFLKEKHEDSRVKPVQCKQSKSDSHLKFAPLRYSRLDQPLPSLSVVLFRVPAVQLQSLHHIRGLGVVKNFQCF